MNTSSPATGIGALLYMRWRQTRGRTRRRLGNLSAYLDWQSAVIALWAAAVFLGAPLYHILFPSALPAGARTMGGLLLTMLVVILLLRAAYQALFSALDGFPGTLQTGDIPFVIAAPVGRSLFLLDRLIWSLAGDLIRGTLLLPLAWVLGRAFLAPWGWGEALSAAALYIAVQMAVQGTGLLLYGLPAPVGRALWVVRAVLWALAALGTIAVLASGNLATGLVLPAAEIPRPPAAAIIGTALLPAAAWAVAAWLLALLTSDPPGEGLVKDALRAERRRARRLTGGTEMTPDRPGVARSSLEGGWFTGWRAVAWRQFAGYRHLTLNAWGARLLRLLGVAAAPSLMAGVMPTAGTGGAALPVLLSILVSVAAASGLAGGWRQEVQEGLARRLMPISGRDLVWGFAFWPAVGIGAASAAGALVYSFMAGWPLAWGLLTLPPAVAAGVLFAMLVLLEGLVMETSPTGPAEGRQLALVANLVLAGLPAVVAGALLSSLGPALALPVVAVLVVVEGAGLAQYVIFRISILR